VTTPYHHTEMPPVIRQTADSHYQLERQSGVVVAEFDQAEMKHPAGWWSELVAEMRANYSDPYDMAHDLTLLMVEGKGPNGWEYIDDR